MAETVEITPEVKAERAEEALKKGFHHDGSMATEEEVLHLLTALVIITKPDVCVETGTYAGHGTRAILSGLDFNDRGHLWTVEIEDQDYPDFPRCTFVHADSAEWSKNEAPAGIDFAWVDCAINPSGRVEVFENLLPRMKSGGIIAAHDATFYPHDEYLEEMIRVAGRAPNLVFSALHGIAIWVT